MSAAEAGREGTGEAGDADGDDDDDELLDAVVDLRPRSAPRRGGPVPSLGGGKSKLKHSFAQLIADSTVSTSALLSSDAFWDGIKDNSADKDVLSLEEEQADLDGSDGNYDALMYDDGVAFPRGTASPKRANGEARRVLLQFIRVLLGSSVATEEECEWALSDGIAGIHLVRADPTMAKAVAVYVSEAPLLLDYIYSERPKLARPLAHLLSGLIGRADVGELLERQWRFAALSTMAQRQDSILQLVSFQAAFLRVHFDRTSLEAVKESFGMLVRLAADKQLYAEGWRALHELALSIVDWLDVSRIDLLPQWCRDGDRVGDGDGSGWGLASHPHRLLRLVTLFGMDEAAHAAALLLLDQALFSPSLPAAPFFQCFQDLLTRSASCAPSLYRVVLLGCARLLRTVLEPSQAAQHQELLRTIAAVKHGLGSQHVAIYIRIRDILGQIEAYVRSYLLRRQRGIIKPFLSSIR